MSEIDDVELIKPNINKRITERRKVTLHSSRKEEDYLGEGAFGFVSRVTVPIKEGVSLGLAYKQIESEGRAANALKAWLRLKGAGVPAPHTFRLVEKDGIYTGILMTDLTHGWRDILISSNPTKAMVIDKVNATHPSTVQRLAALDIEDPAFVEKLERQIAAIADKTAKNKIGLESGDVVSAVYKHTGELDLIISDMDNVRVDSPESYGSLFANNLDRASLAKLLVNDAHRLARKLQGLKTANK